MLPSLDKFQLVCRRRCDVVLFPICPVGRTFTAAWGYKLAVSTRYIGNYRDPGPFECMLYLPPYRRHGFGVYKKSGVSRRSNKQSVRDQGHTSNSKSIFWARVSLLSTLPLSAPFALRPSSPPLSIGCASPPPPVRTSLPPSVNSSLALRFEIFSDVFCVIFCIAYGNKAVPL